MDFNYIRDCVKVLNYEKPPESFWSLSVWPTREDILVGQPFLRANVVSGAYRDVPHYLDVQFRLLREDYMGPLREGIAEFIQHPDKQKYDKIWVHRNVKFVEPYNTKNKIGKTAMLDGNSIKSLKRVNWAESKRFIYGGLLLFTKDNCKTFITATVLERDLKLLKQGKIPVTIIDKSVEPDIKSNDPSYTMIESEVYFEPYYHVLKAMQDNDFHRQLAMEKYIVRVETNPGYPAYMILRYNLTYSVKTSNNRITTFQPLNQHSWPTGDKFGFNESQYEAYKLALTRELAVVQGPPGTGKTFLAIKVATALLENVTHRPEQCLMFVTCYTNHALDQFLEALLPVTKSIVRIGGQSRNKALEDINLNNLRSKKHKGVDYRIKNMFHVRIKKLNYAVSKLKCVQKKLYSLNNGVVSYQSLEKLVPLVRLEKFYYLCHHYTGVDPLAFWLFENMPMDYENIDNWLRAESCEDRNQDEHTDNKVSYNVLDNRDVNVALGDPNAEFTLSFSLEDTQKKIESLLMQYKKTKDPVLKSEIVYKKCRENYFIRMVHNKRRDTGTRVYCNRTATDYMNLPAERRWELYFQWTSVISDRLADLMRTIQAEVDSATAAYEESRVLVDAQILRGIKVIGMTTSGAASNRRLLQALAPKITIIEEAAEVLEQHIVTSLTKHCEHLILIGDHQQLRPKAAYIELARRYGLEVSLFERMVSNGVLSRRLSTQHRARPAIAALISPHIYRDLLNHHSVENFPDVRGMSDNLFFFTHNYMEKAAEDTSTILNPLEGEMALKLAQYLLQQGYEPSDVTILTPYGGQVAYLNKQRGTYSSLSEVKMTTVDRYQGEESKIIVLSLVRNNLRNSIGFLGTENRVCVALSRAREGLYILGNINILRKNSKLWQNIAKTLEEQQSLGPALNLKCQAHGNITQISRPKDFEKVRDGGCSAPCDLKLACGQKCPLRCHPSRPNDDTDAHTRHCRVCRSRSNFAPEPTHYRTVLPQVEDLQINTFAVVVVAIVMRVFTWIAKAWRRP